MSGNSFGKMFRITSFGDSHSGVVGVVINGCPAGYKISLEEIQHELNRRRPGTGLTVSERDEPDILEVISGIVDGKTDGSQIKLQVKNVDTRPSDYDEIIHKPRPGHADLTYYQKYGKISPGGGRSSARETVGRVLAGAVAKQFLIKEGITIHGKIIEVRGKTTNFENNILEIKAENDSVGGIVEIIADGVPAGLGEPVFDKLDADMSKALMSIGSVKGVEIGAGFSSTLKRGSENNDQIIIENGNLLTTTNNAGGILGGISNGMPIICRIAVKPTSSIGIEQDTVDLKTMKPAKIIVNGRHDPCICSRLVPVAEAMVAITILDHLMRASNEKIQKSIPEMRNGVRNIDAELIRLLGERLVLTDSIGNEKKKLGMPVYNPETERKVIDNVRKIAAELDISQSTAEAVIRTAMAEARLRQDADSKVNSVSGIRTARYLPPPMEFMGAVPLSPKAAATVNSCREDIKNILDGKDNRKILILGPCSIHDVAQAEEYAKRLISLKKKVNDRLLLVMRVYIEKSRSGKGWTGFITDPRLDGSGDVQEGITMTRKLLNTLGEMGVPAAVELINPLTASYIGDMVSWAAIGARSSSSQVHRDMASGLPMPVGFKNSPDGEIDAAIGAVQSAGQGHDYLGLDDTGSIVAFKTAGNSYCHLVLRGGKNPNYDEKNIMKVQKALKTAGLSTRLVVDCSHGNSEKIAGNQPEVFANIIDQIKAGNHAIIGLMLESQLNSGKQELVPGRLEHGVSVTDECLGWDETEKIILAGYEKLK